MKRIFLAFLFLLLPLTCITKAQDSTKIRELEKRIKALEEKEAQNELQKIISEAETAVATAKEQRKLKTFKSGQRSQQALNPELSITGDSFLQYSKNNSEAKTGAYFRTVGFHLQSNLDPFSFAKVAIGVSPKGIGLGEAYVTWANFLPRISLTAGKFRQQFGVINRWHLHSLDQFDFPLALTTIFGAEGLNQIGLSFNWLMPSLIANANELTLQITNAQNDVLFPHNVFGFPAVLAHLKNYYDLNRNTYLEFGITGLFGKANEQYSLPSGKNLDYNSSVVGGIDLTLSWEPVNQALYQGFIWRSEFYYAKKYNTQAEKVISLGGYSYFEYKFSEQWQAGLRLDYSTPYQTDKSSDYLYQIVPYITFWQSHWVKLRLQYNYLDGKNMTEGTQALRLQLVWAAGPHKHERY